jgi:hypothetical protein
MRSAANREAGLGSLLKNVNVSDAEMIERFEAGAVPESEFHHEDHVRLAYAYLRTYPPLEALNRFCCALKRFAADHGKAERYHETITFAYFFLISERMARMGRSDWQEFSECNPDLLTENSGILRSYYEEPTLKSELARRIFLLPDRASTRSRLPNDETRVISARS